MTPMMLRKQFFASHKKLSEGFSTKEQISKSISAISGEYRALQMLSASVSKDPQANKAFQQALRDLADAIADLREVAESRVLD